MPKPTLKDIAQAAGVSAMTVSKALNGKPGVSEERRKEIRDIAERMNYAPNLIAKSLRVDETKTIGVVLSDTSEMVLSKVLRGIQDGATNHGYSVIIANTDHQPERELRSIRTLLSKQIDGLILVAPTLYTNEHIAFLKNFGIPFIFLMRKNDHSEIDTVINDNYLGGYQSIAHLVSEGCHSFQILSLSNSQSSQEREMGYRQAFSDFKIPISPEQFHAVTPFVEAGYDAAKQILTQCKRFDALVCGCDTVAIGAMDALLEAGIKIPSAVRLIGYDGIDLARYLRIPLTTMAQPLYAIGLNGIEILLDRIRFPQMPVRKLVLKSELVIRRSTHA